MVEICERIRSELDYNSDSLIQSFRALDWNGSHVIKVNEAFEVLSQRGIYLDEASEQIIMQRLRLSSYSPVNYLRVVSLIFFGHTSIDKNNSGHLMNIYQDFSKELRNEIQLRKVPSSQLWLEFDTDSSGRVNLEEFKTGVTRRGFYYPIETIEKLYHECAIPKGKGFVAISDFRRLIFGNCGKDIKPLMIKFRN